MSTRSTTHFIGHDGKTQAIIYRHPDGYPEGHGRDLYQFLDDVEEHASDTRFGDPSYLAAKLVVWLVTERFAFSHDWSKGGGGERTPNHPLDFISVGVLLEDPGDIEYRYKVRCDQLSSLGRPLIECWEVPFDAGPDDGKLVEIPLDGPPIT